MKIVFSRCSLILHRVILVMMLLASTMVGSAQSQQVEMADGMRSNGKIYIVVAVCLTILIGLFVYVFSLDRKISKMEKEV